MSSIPVLQKESRMDCRSELPFNVSNSYGPNLAIYNTVYVLMKAALLTSLLK